MRMKTVYDRFIEDIAQSRALVSVGSARFTPTAVDLSPGTNSHFSQGSFPPETIPSMLLSLVHGGSGSARGCGFGVAI